MFVKIFTFHGVLSRCEAWLIINFWTHKYVFFVKTFMFIQKNWAGEAAQWCIFSVYTRYTVRLESILSRRIICIDFSFSRIQNKENAPIEVFKTHWKGFGIRATEDIPQVWMNKIFITHLTHAFWSFFKNIIWLHGFYYVRMLYLKDLIFTHPFSCFR